MRYSFEQLEAFMVTVELGSFSAAARRLGKAQSSVSGLIANMEIDTGFELFNRSSRSPKLTDKGKLLIREINNVLKSHEILSSKALNIAENIEHQIRIAYDNTSFPQELLIDILDRFDSKFPDISLLILNSSHHDAFRLLKNNQADMAITVSLEDYPEGVNFQGFSHVHFFTSVVNTHPLTKLDSVSMEDLSDHRHIRVTDSVAGIRHHEYDVSKKIWFTDTTNLMVDMVRSGLGWAQLPAHIIALHRDLVKLPTSNQLVSFPQNVDLIWSSAMVYGAAFEWLVRELSQIGKQLIKST